MESHSEKASIRPPQGLRTGQRLTIDNATLTEAKQNGSKQVDGTSQSTKYWLNLMKQCTTKQTTQGRKL